MKVFYRSGIVNENLMLAEVKSCKWKEGFVDWVYETYPQCYEVLQKLGEVKITNLPGKYDFIDFKKYIGSLPGVHPVYEATEEKVKIFLETKERIQKEKEEVDKKAKEAYKKRKKEREQRKLQFTIVKTYKLQYPKGDEFNGQDGYFDADLKSIDGQIIRMVARNVFDFGYYCYPKRVEGSNSVFKRENWTEIEKQAEKWLHEFSPFITEIRM